MSLRDKVGLAAADTDVIDPATVAAILAEAGDLGRTVSASMFLEAAETVAPELAQGSTLTPLLTACRKAYHAVRSSWEDAAASKLADLRALHYAREALKTELNPPAPFPQLATLADLLREPPPAIEWRIEGWFPAQSRGIIAAQYKAGKTTLLGNLIRSVIDGEPFLGTAATKPVSRVALIDLEMSPITLTRWLYDLSIIHSDRVTVVPLRGRVSAFDITNTGRRREWAERLNGHDLVIVDPLRALLDALGLDEKAEAGPVLNAFDALCLEAGFAEGVIAHHWGHAGERSRGDSRLLDWPDWTWGIARQDDDPASSRYITGYGRDVDQPEQQLGYDEASRRLTLVGGTRKDAAARAALDDVTELLRTEPGLSGNQIWKRLADSAEHGQKAIRKGLSIGVIDGLIRVDEGPRNAKLHTLSSSVRRSSSPVRQRGGGEFVSSSIEDELNSPTDEDSDFVTQRGPVDEAITNLEDAGLDLEELY